MLLQILRRYLKPYTREIAIVIVLQTIGTIAALYLPSLRFHSVYRWTPPPLVPPEEDVDEAS